MSGGNQDFFRDQIWTFIGVVAAVIIGLAAIFVTIAVSGKSPNNIINVNPQPGITVTITPQPTPIPPTPTPTPTDTPVPTPTLTASQILTDAATANGVYANDTPIAYTSNFVVGQSVYITFQIHTGGQEGYLTTQWYANNQYIYRGANYPVLANSVHGYSKYAYSAAAYGAVRLYWCTQSDCSDGQLAATVTFNVYT